MTSDSGIRVTAGMIIGSTILLFGVLFGLELFDVIHTHELEQFWPAGIIALGASVIALKRGFWNFCLGGIIALAGVNLLFDRLDWWNEVENFLMDDDSHIFGIAALVGIGFYMVWRSVSKQIQAAKEKKIAEDAVHEASMAYAPPQQSPPPTFMPPVSEPVAPPPAANPEPKSADAPKKKNGRWNNLWKHVGYGTWEEDPETGEWHKKKKGEAPIPAAPKPNSNATPTRVDAFAIMGGVEKSVTTANLRGGSLNAIMGGCDIDLRQASFPTDKVTLDVFAMWGGVEIRVPEDWTVVSKVVAVMGAASDKTYSRDPDGKKRLVIRGMALMGGIEVTN